MMDLHQRLRQIHGHQKEREPMKKRDPRPIFEGQEKTNEKGAYFLREKTYSFDDWLQKISLPESLEMDVSLFPLLQEDLLGVQQEDLLFLDTETTGLMGGTGNVAFMVGIGYCKNGVFHVQQYLLRDYYEEEALLFSLRESISSFKGMVFFNGKAFDLPLLKTRFTLHRLSFPWEDLFYLDLLHWGRRLWQRRIGGCSLKNLEEMILGFTRRDDVEGYMIPPLFFEYLETGNGDLLRSIFLHNAYDLLSMLSLMAVILQSIERPHRVEYGQDIYSLARYFERDGRLDRALSLYELALKKSSSSAYDYMVKKDLSLLYKREKEYREAKEIWEEMVEEEIDFLFPYLELAKYYEHRAHDYVRAYHYGELALKKVQKRSFLYHRSEVQQLKHRLQRITGKIERVNYPRLKSWVSE